MIAASDQLKHVPPAVRPIVQAAVKVVREVAPRAEEIAYAMAQPRSPRTMWKLRRYAAHGENVVGIGTFPDHSALYFYRGVDLDDPNGLLAGGGKQMRFVRLDSPADANRAAVKSLVRRAFRLAKASA
ncbi:MAG TPA: DUF1801 domain-containing protein [Candidatus Dormibacteraeota bacterium]|nr:DUF1801 domain-containing protein [Candidatus Dormibacteraeota bacterium]